MTDTRERARVWLNGQLLYLGSERVLLEPSTMPDDHAVGITIGQILQIASAFAESELELARFAPLGDNHHNAHKCPHCNPEREKELALARKQEREANCKSMCKQCADTFFWAAPTKRGDNWLHSCLNVPGVAPCQAAAIHERNLAETGG